ncbi:MAG: DUF6033 family protein [Bacteroides sp.]|nr:DUF6033 family protein [Eubacterium sp.]MCM1419405.1 DUF6033 family protein [Roseburia sp.]MCM1463239.1 DUF6033 family protein [Bacteroides sp.]
MNITGMGAFRAPGRGTSAAPSGGADFGECLSEALESAELSAAEAYKSRLEARFGGIRIESVEKDQRSMDRLGAATSGTGNVVIAPNIFEKMANDPETAAFYEKKIAHYFDMVPVYEAQLSMMGFETVSSGIVIHPDGSVTHYCCADLKPEVRRRIEAQIKAETEAKRKRHENTARLGRETAIRRSEEASALLRAQSLGKTAVDRPPATERRTVFSPAETPEALLTAYRAILS